MRVMNWFKKIFKKIFTKSKPTVVAPPSQPPSPNSSRPWLDWMIANKGEVLKTGSLPTKFVISIFKHTNYGALKKYTPPCCAAAICAALEQSGYKSTKSAAAKSYMEYGTECELKPGAIVVFSFKPGSHHVAVCESLSPVPGFANFVGGNQSSMLKTSKYAKLSIRACRWPVK